jgi:hypothetical protein
MGATEGVLCQLVARLPGSEGPHQLSGWWVAAKVFELASAAEGDSEDPNKGYDDED